jgi:hypothetical protein
MNRRISRRALLRGAGVALTLPWLDSLAPELARAQAATYPKRFLPIFFPNGSANYWRPGNAGQGAGWTLSPILQPFEKLKSKLTVLTNMENYSCFRPDSPSVEPSHGRQPGAFLACVDGTLVKDKLKVAEANGISADQVIAQHASMAGLSALPSMQVGLSTWYSYCDGKPCSISRSISWSSETKPMYKLVDPLEVFNQIVGAAGPTQPPTTGDPELERRVALNKSVLDAVLENASRTRSRLGSSDQKKMDEFLESVRSVEKRVTKVSSGMGGKACAPIGRPTLTAAPNSPQRTTATYDKGTHADVMNDLIVMAFQCDVTRVISYMLEDERSEYVYDHVPKRKFSATGSAPGTGTCGNYHGAQHAGDVNDDFSTISWWNAGKAAALCEKLDAIEDGPGVSVLDNSVVVYASCMHGGNHQANELPVAIIGSGGGKLKTDQHVVFPATPGDRPMRDLYFTIMNTCFGLGVTSFGVNTKGAPNQLIREIIA